MKTNEINKRQAMNISELNWNAGEIMEANFMFPTEHFDKLSDLTDLSDDQFNNLIIGMSEPCLPFTEIEKNVMIRSVKSHNRLRVYYHSLKILDRHLGVINDTQDVDHTDKDIDDVMGHLVVKGKVTIVGENIPDKVSKEFAECNL